MNLLSTTGRALTVALTLGIGQSAVAQTQTVTSPTRNSVTLDGVVTAAEYGNVGPFTAGGTGFGGILGNSSLYVADDATNIYFGFTNVVGQGSNVIQLYLDTRAGGTNGNFNQTDVSDNFRALISRLGDSPTGNTPRVQYPLAGTDFVLAFDGTNQALYDISTGSALTFTPGTTVARSGNTIEFSIPKLALGLPAAPFTLNLFALLSNGEGTVGSQNRFLSNEGVPATGFGGNPGTDAASNYVFNNFDRYVASVPDQGLPVELQSFTGRASGSGIGLSWTVATERDNAGFVIERSSGGAFKEIASFSSTPSLRGRGTASDAKTYGYTDARVAPGARYSYRLIDVSTGGVKTVHTAIEVQAAEATAPTKYALAQNQPNPFNPATTIQFAVPQTGHVELVVYNTLGTAIRTLVSGNLTPDTYTVRFDAGALPSGIYLYRLTAPGFVQTRRMLLVK